MNGENLFTEKQKFTQWWIWIVLLGMNALFLFGIYKQFILKQTFGKNPMSNNELLIATGLCIAIALFFLSLKLETIIKKDGIYVRFFPFHLKFKYYSWDSLTKSYLRQYSPLIEYGGWGMRLGLFGKGKAYNVSGNRGLQLEFTNQKKLLIGTNKPEEISAALLSIGQLKS